MHPLKLVEIKDPFGILQPTTRILREWVGFFLFQKNMFWWDTLVTIYPQLVNISPEIILILQNMLIYALFIDCCEMHLHTFCYGNPSISEKPS